MGRQLAYNREALLEQVMHLFWKNGYQATSVSQLVEQTRVKPGSLYHGFDNKKGLLLAALDYYGQRSLERARDSLAAHGCFRDAVAEFFQRTLQISEQNPPGRCCFLVTTWLELGAHDPAVRLRIEQNLRRVEGLFRDAAEQARQRGELAAHSCPATIAKTVMASLWGLRVLRSTDAAPEQLQAVCDQLLGTFEVRA